MVAELNPVRASFDISRVLGNVFRAVGQNAPVFFSLSAILLGLPLVGVGLVQYLMFEQMLGPTGMATGGGGANPAAFFTNWLISMGVNILTLVLTSLLQAALSHGVFSSLNGRRAGLGECLNTGLRFMLPAILIGLVSAIGIVFGLIFLIIPGVILALGWSVAVPVAVVERKGVFESIGRSWGLTNGNKAQIFLIALVYIVGSWLAGMLVVAVTGVIATVNMSAMMIATFMIATPVASAVTSVFGAAGAAAIYYELRYTKESVGADQMADVFT